MIEDYSSWNDINSCERCVVTDRSNNFTRSNTFQESLRSDKKEGGDETEERKRNENKFQKKTTNHTSSDVDYKENKRQKRVDRDNHYDRDRQSYWKNNDRDGKEYYSKKDHLGGKVNRPVKGGRSDGRNERPSNNYRTNFDEAPKDTSSNMSKEGSNDGKDREPSSFKDRDDATKSNKRCPPKNPGKSQDVRSEQSTDEVTGDRPQKRDTETDYPTSNKQNGRDEASKTHHACDKNGEPSFKKDINQHDEFGYRQGGRQRGGRGGKGRDYSDIGDPHCEER